MVTQAERKAMIAKIRAVPENAEAAVRGLSDRQFDTPCGDGKWTVRQVIHHLADSHMNGFIRMKLAVTENYPTLKPYEQDDWATTPDTTAPANASLAILRGLHARWCALLDSLPESAWARAAYHPENGKMTLDDLLTLYAKHGEHHLEQIAALRLRMGW